MPALQRAQQESANNGAVPHWWVLYTCVTSVETEMGRVGDRGAPAETRTS